MPRFFPYCPVCRGMSDQPFYCSCGGTNFLKDKQVRCTNCGMYHSSGPYCYRCGVPTQLKQEGVCFLAGCYVATEIYGEPSYELEVLRKWRDEFLEKYILGRVITKVYYIVSPIFVKLIRDRNKLKKIIRLILNKFIKLIE